MASHTGGEACVCELSVGIDTAAGVDPDRFYSDKLSGTSTREQRPGLAALLFYARAGDAVVVVGIDQLGRNAAEAMTTIRELGQRVGGYPRAADYRRLLPSARFLRRTRHQPCWHDRSNRSTICV